MTSANFIAVDLGASSGRVVLGQWDGRRFELQDLHRFANRPLEIEGHLYWDVEGLWAQIKRGLASYTARFDTPLRAIGVDSWAVDYALLDQTGRLLGRPYHYRDLRLTGVDRQVWQRVSPRQIFAMTGIQFLPFNTLYQLYSHFHSNDPALQQADRLLLIPDLFHYWLSGRQVAEYTNATTTQFFDCHQHGWATSLLAELGLLARLLPPVVQPGTILGPVLPHLAREVGLPGNVSIIAPGSHDTASAVAAIPGLEDGRSAYLSSGTWSLLGLELKAPIVDERSLAANFTNEGGVDGTVRLLKNVAGLWLLQECQRNWQAQGQDYSWPQLLALAEQASPLESLLDPDAPDFLNPPDMLEAIEHYCRNTGQTPPHSPAQIVRCCLESLALKYRVVLEKLQEITSRIIETLRVVGGGSQNWLLCQFTADACQREVVAGPVEATALGNIMMQAIATGYLSDVTAGRRAVGASFELTRYRPDQTTAPQWEEAYRRFKRLLNGQGEY